ncbi:MAG: hypothetical protein PHN80_09360 [Hespellia sp.]|nr:hypothetical protein [Hespellia sp.]
MKKIVKTAVLIILIAAVAVLYSNSVWPYEIYDSSIDSSAYENTGELLENSKIEQRFIGKHNGLESLELTVSNLNQECDAEYKWSLIEATSGNVVGEGVIDSEKVDNSKPYKLEFERIPTSKDVEYNLVIDTKQIKSEHGIVLMTTEKDSSQNGTLRIDQVDSSKNLVLVQEVKFFNIETFVVFVGLMIYLALFIKFLFKIFE